MRLMHLGSHLVAAPFPDAWLAATAAIVLVPLLAHVMLPSHQPTPSRPVVQMRCPGYPIIFSRRTPGGIRVWLARAVDGSVPIAVH